MTTRLFALAICAASYLALGGCGKYGAPLREPPEVPEASEAAAPDAAPDESDEDED